MRRRHFFSRLLGWLAVPFVPQAARVVKETPRLKPTPMDKWGSFLGPRFSATEAANHAIHLRANKEYVRMLADQCEREYAAVARDFWKKNDYGTEYVEDYQI